MDTKRGKYHHQEGLFNSALTVIRSARSKDRGQKIHFTRDENKIKYFTWGYMTESPLT
jgi:hypothetical protein